jgi:hypothetical protein
LSSPLSDYVRAVGLVNLLAAYVTLEHRGEAARTLMELETITTKNNYVRLQANICELGAQLFIQNGDLAQAGQSLRRAADILGTNQTRDQLWIKKWGAVLQSIKSNSGRALREFRKEAVLRKHWESVRESDFYSLKINFDRERFEYLMSGTPYPAYRQRVLRHLGQTLDKSYFSSGDMSGNLMDLQNGQVILHGKTVSMPPLLHKLTGALMSDFYRPLPMGSLFGKLFPGEHFNIFHSPDRVYQAVYRCRSWFAENGVPMAIHEDSGSYSISHDRRLTVLIPYNGRVLSGMESMLRQAGQLAPKNKPIRAGELLGPLGISAATATRFLNWAVENGFAVRSGQGRGTRYFLKAS